MPDDARTFIEDCPVCHRVKWTNALCDHGQIPPPDPEPPKEVVPEKRPKLAGGKKPDRAN